MAPKLASKCGTSILFGTAGLTVAINPLNRVRDCLVLKESKISAGLEDEEGFTKLIKCSVRSQHGNDCVALIPKWLPRRMHRGFKNQPLHCGFCAVMEIVELRYIAATSKWPVISTQQTSPFNTDSNAQYGWRQKVRIFGVKKEEDEGMYPKVFDVVPEAVEEVPNEVICICHRVHSKTVKDGEWRQKIVKIVRRQTKKINIKEIQAEGCQQTSHH